VTPRDQVMGIIFGLIAFIPFVLTGVMSLILGLDSLVSGYVRYKLAIYTKSESPIGYWIFTVFLLLFAVAIFSLSAMLVVQAIMAAVNLPNDS